jgi:hypothetical protein
MLDPCTVTDADHVPARFTQRVALKIPVLTEYASDMLPTRPPAVITIRRVPQVP